MPRPMPISVPLTDLNLVPVPFLRREKRGRRLDANQAAAFVLLG